VVRAGRRPTPANAASRAPEALAATFAFPAAQDPPPNVDGERLSYPEWLDRL
jgi:hypothetical protein